MHTWFALAMVAVSTINRRTTKRGPKRVFSAAIFKERVRHAFIAQLHYAFKTLAYTMIILRHFCRG